MALAVSNKDAFVISVIKLAKVKHCQQAVFRQEWVKCLHLLEWEKMMASVFKKIPFVRLCARLTMNFELLIALCDRINHLKKLACSVKNMSECIWQLLGDVLGCSEGILESSETLVAGSQKVFGRSWVGFASFKIDLERLFGPFGLTEVILNRFWNEFGAKMTPKTVPQGQKKMIWNANRIHACVQTAKADFERPSHENSWFWDVQRCPNSFARA